jgi:hypothetical protein
VGDSTEAGGTALQDAGATRVSDIIEALAAILAAGQHMPEDGDRGINRTLAFHTLAVSCHVSRECESWLSASSSLPKGRPRSPETFRRSPSTGEDLDRHDPVPTSTSSTGGAIAPISPDAFMAIRDTRRRGFAAGQHEARLNRTVSVSVEG